MLAESKYPLDCNMTGGVTALMICAEDIKMFQACHSMIINGANINKVSDHGKSALDMAVQGDNKKLAQLLLRRNAKVFYSEGKWRDNSPFFQAIISEK